MSYSTKYKIIKENVNGNTQFGLLISRNKSKVYINKISSNKSKVKNMISKMRTYNVDPEIAREIVEDLLV